MGERSRLAFQRHRSRLGALLEGNRRGELGALLRNDARFVALYKDIYTEMAKPYLFSDHANKSFERQYRHLRRAVPDAFAPRVAARESMRGLPPGRLSAGARRAIAAYMLADRTTCCCAPWLWPPTPPPPGTATAARTECVPRTPRQVG